MRSARVEVLAPAPKREKPEFSTGALHASVRYWLSVLLTAVLFAAVPAVEVWNEDWLRAAFVVAVTFAAALVLVFNLVQRRRPRLTVTAQFCFIAGLYGSWQFLSGVSAYPYASGEAALDWFAFAAVGVLSSQWFSHGAGRQVAGSALVLLGTGSAGIALLSLTTGGGFQSAFVSSSAYAQFAELIFPICVTRAISDSQKQTLYSLLSALLVATTLASRSRMGSAILLLEIVVLLLWIRSSRAQDSFAWLRAGSAIIALSLVGFLLIGPWAALDRIFHEDFVEGRDAITRDTLKLIASNPVGGHGLGTFQYVYPSVSSRELGGLVNHAHNDLLEAVADGGIGFGLLMVALFARLVWKIRGRLWAIGIVGVLIHSLSDFPLHRLSIMMFLFVLAGMLETTEALRLQRNPLVGRSRK